MSSLTLLKWIDSNGQVQRLRIRNEISSRWLEIGDLLGLDMERLEQIEVENRGHVSMCFCDVLMDWLRHDNQNNYPASWQGLAELLEDMDLPNLACWLQHAIDLK